MREKATKTITLMCIMAIHAKHEIKTGLAKASKLSEEDTLRIAKSIEEKSTNIEAQTPKKPKDQAAPYRLRRNELLRKVDPAITQKAWFTLSHLLLNENATIVDMGCGDGAMTYAMAALEPKMKFIGIDKNKRQINKANEKFALKNLSFQVDTAAAATFAPESLDAIVNSYILHEVFSGARYNTQSVSDAMRGQFAALKKGGLMFIRDYARPPPNEMVFIEMPDKHGSGDTLATMSESDLLIWYSARARPKQDPGCGGFFLEEAPARIPQTRLFRLPYKWAYEFLMRKDERARWETELPIEYTFFTKREFRKEIGAMGGRAEYTTPYWDEDIIAKKFDGKFRLFDDRMNPIGTPPTCFIAVARKMSERKSLNIEERRPSMTGESALRITTMRNEKTGTLSEVVSRDFGVNEIMPYRISSDKRLRIYLHDGIPRAIANAVPRKGINIDGKQWSGHMVETISIDETIMHEIEEFDVKHTALFARDYLGLKPQSGETLITGDHYYPAPDYIDEKIQTYYLPVEKNTKTIAPRNILGYAAKFQAKGALREFDAQQVLDAISIGMIPNARLELQIMSLFQRLNIRPESWSSKDLTLHIIKATSIGKMKNYARMLNEPDKRFREVKGTIGQLRNIHSVFVEEGKTQGAMSGLSAQDVDFVISEERTINTAVIIPLTKNMREEVHVGTLIQHLPVPQRHKGNGLTFSAPSFDIPAHLTTSAEIKRFIAEKFSVAPDCVTKLGESYFCHVGMTHQRIHPYAIAAPPDTINIDIPATVFLPINEFRALWKNIKPDTHMMTVLARSWKYLPPVMRRAAKFEARQIAAHEVEMQGQGFEPDWVVPETYEMAPTIEQAPAPEITLDKKIEGLKQVIDAKILPPKEEAKIREKIEGFALKSEKSATGKKTTTILSAEFEQDIDSLIEELENNPSLDFRLS